MDDATVLQTVWLSPDVVSDTNYRIVGVLDLNADGKPDLLWQHTTSGELAVWYLNGLTLTSSAYLTPRYLSDVNWRIVGVR